LPLWMAFDWSPQGLLRSEAKEWSPKVPAKLDKTRPEYCAFFGATFEAILLCMLVYTVYLVCTLYRNARFGRGRRVDKINLAKKVITCIM
jgi:hypothetical protein